jgi:dTDP-glucose 4,6-dehydratase
MDLNNRMADIKSLLARERPSYIINFAAQSEVGPSWDNPDQWFRTNAVAVADLGNYLKDKDWLDRYVHISSPEVYGTCEGVVKEDAPFNPSTPYAASKAAGDLMLSTLVKNYHFPVVTIRATNVYGPGQQLFKIIPRTIIYLKLGKKIRLHGGGRAVKSYIHIRDVSKGELSAMEKGTPGQIYHLSPDRGYAVRDVVETLSNKMGYRFESVTQAVEERLGQDAAYIIDSSKARQEFGWAPAIRLKDGLKEVVDWIEANWEEIKKTPLEYEHKP